MLERWKGHHRWVEGGKWVEGMEVEIFGGLERRTRGWGREGERGLGCERGGGWGVDVG